MEFLTVYFRKIAKFGSLEGPQFIGRIQCQKCIVFVGVSDDLQEQIKRVRGLRVNIVLIVDTKERLFRSVDEAFCYESQCAVLESTVHQIDSINNILMTADERIIAFDECVIVNDYKR